ncbi:tetratricopeptide repeat protein [Corynebacterium renale]|uniref:Tetratricopeptide repeat protein n=1 Tax=Corynebacterium renale TaxID=1724 RepID=A0A2A9DQW8_9CORY|nr:tetratricopeptide repeat protein [Corynebacterium renale]PFG28781.1 hypothetical protein ATK06_1902 [Corynebacterium renale]
MADYRSDRSEHSRRNDSKRGSYRGRNGRNSHDRTEDGEHRRSQGRKDDRSGRRFGNRDDRRDDNRRGNGPRQGGERRRDDRNREDRRGGDNRRGQGNSGSRSQRGGSGRGYERRSNPQRPGYREERINKRINEPDIPDDIDVRDLDPLVLQDLKVLSKQNADAVAKHMIMAATWMDDDPQLALRHARAAKDRGGRVAITRETNGIAAYRAGEWKEALSELRAARRMGGGPGLLAVMADCERGLGRPLKAIELGRSDEAAELDSDSAVELAIVVAGARHDLGQHDSALVTLERKNPSKEASDVTGVRLAYAYADALELLGRFDEAREWFESVAKNDVDGYTDAEDRVSSLSK